MLSPFWEYIERGVNVALATNSFSHDLLGDFRIAAVFGKIRQGSVGRPKADDVVRCATHGSATALGRKDLGNLNAGSRGDVLVVDLRTPYNAPVFDPLRALVYYSSGADVRYSLVDGRLVVAEGRVVGSDVDAVRAKVEAACSRLWAQASEAPGTLPLGSTWYRRSIPSA